LDGIDDNWSEGEILKLATFVQSTADRVLRGFSLDERGFRPKHGPGAVAEEFYSSKYEFPSWPTRLELEYPFAHWGQINELEYSNVGHQCEMSGIDNWDVEVPAKLAYVPKDYKGPRLIASESICNQWIQQGINTQLRQLIAKSVLRHSINLADQEPSKQAALNASVDGRFATIDLSSASDRLSCAVVECMFRSNYRTLERFNAARSKGILIKQRKMTLLCNKFAAQGAAFTFPIQSIAYAIICMGVIQNHYPKMRMADIGRKVRVFGDDMIVPADMFQPVALMLTALHLVVNRDKSFHTGLFRESCGMDAFAGHDVTPAYVKQAAPRLVNPLHTVSVVECSNNLYHKGFIRASATLLDTLAPNIRRGLAYVPWDSTAFGIQGPNKRARRSRWNSELQRVEHQVLTVVVKLHRTEVSGSLRLFQWFTENPRPDAIDWQPGEVTKKVALHCNQWVALG